jgi:hypothetical protein
VAIEIVCVSDSELEQLAKERGSRSIEARVVRQLRKYRAKDFQAYAFRVGRYYFAGSVPDAVTELAILALAAAPWRRARARRPRRRRGRR